MRGSRCCRGRGRRGGDADPLASYQCSSASRMVPSDRPCDDCCPHRAQLTRPRGKAALWFAKIRPADATKEEVHCVLRRDHSCLRAKGVTIPGTARWRWVAKDETSWVRCMFGCCQVY